MPSSGSNHLSFHISMPVDTTKPTLSHKSRRPSKKDLDEDRLDSSHAREIELKRSRGEISCAECRRCDQSHTHGSVLLTPFLSVS